MKKFVILILSLLYITTSLGAGINLHYCMGKLVDSSFFSLDKKACSKCGMDKSETDAANCCKDEHKKIKVQDEHQFTLMVNLQMQAAGTALLGPTYEMQEVRMAAAFHQHPLSHAPPRTGNLAVFIRNCNFRI